MARDEGHKCLGVADCAAIRQERGLDLQADIRRGDGPRAALQPHVAVVGPDGDNRLIHLTAERMVREPAEEFRADCRVAAHVEDDALGPGQLRQDVRVEIIIVEAVEVHIEVAGFQFGVTRQPSLAQPGAAERGVVRRLARQRYRVAFAL